MILTAKNEPEAEPWSQELAADWAACKCFFRRMDKLWVNLLPRSTLVWSTGTRRSSSIGFFVDQDHEGQGYVTESVRAALDFVFEHLQAQRVSLRCNSTNLRSQRVAERCGFTREAAITAEKAPPGW